MSEIITSSYSVQNSNGDNDKIEETVLRNLFNGGCAYTAEF